VCTASRHYEEVQAARENGCENSLKISTAMGSKSFFSVLMVLYQMRGRIHGKGGIET